MPQKASKMQNFNGESPKIAYILPNLFTAGSIFLGVTSMLASFHGDFNKAIIYIVLSLVLDGLDGRVARLTHTTSKFGVEFDSLADIVAFGVAPAVLFYFAVGQNFGRVGVLIMAIYVIFGAIRLARFNVTTGTYDPSVFIGLPIPTAAITTAFWIGIYNEYEIFKNLGVIYIICVAILSLLMVSNVRYPSFKKINFKQPYFMKILIILVIVFSCIYLYPLEFCAFLTSGYVFYGLIRAAYNICNSKFKRKNERG